AADASPRRRPPTSWRCGWSKRSGRSKERKLALSPERRADPAARLRLELEQPYFVRNPASVSGHRSVSADHAVTRDDDRDRILPVRPPHRAHGVGIVEPPR